MKTVRIVLRKELDHNGPLVVSMPQCTECGSTYNPGAPFCPSCGTRTNAAKPFSYTGSVLLGVVLLALVFCWQIAPAPTPEDSVQSVVQAPPPDEAKMLIAACGTPDLDHSAENDKPRPDPNHRWLIYRKARVRAIFVRSGPNAPWTRQAMLDSKTLRPLAPEVLTKRLPCANLNGK
jgi:hypothetical protein